MLILLSPNITQVQIRAVEERVRSLGCEPRVIEGALQAAIGVIGNKSTMEPDLFKAMPGVADAVRVSQPFKLVSREMKNTDTVVPAGGVPFGGKEFIVIAGPCAVESYEQVLATAKAVKRGGARMLRAGAFKPRTSPYDFQGLKGEGLAILKAARDETGLKIVTEAKDTATLPAVADVADIVQIGARNMQNFSLLEAVGDLDQPVILKRGMSATIKELLMAAEYIVSRGNNNVILCERGIRTFETMTRNTFDINAIPMLKQLSHLPVLADPSHGVGIRRAVPAITRAAAAAGADGVIVEVHPDPACALSDGPQSLDFAGFEEMMIGLRAITSALGRPIHEERRICEPA